MIKIIEGDILQASEDIIGHQVNCMGVMGAGLAKQIKNKYPFAYQCYKYFCDEQEDKLKLLGSTKFCKMDDGKIIVHMFGQLNYGRGLQTNYEALKRTLKIVEIKARNYEYSVALPYGIGCGLAGGDWDIVYEMIEDVFKDYEVSLYKLK